MKKIIKKTRKFRIINPDKTYYTIHNDQLCQLRFKKAEFSTICNTTGYLEAKYEIAGFGIFESKEIPRIYNTKEDAINGKNRVSTYFSGPALLFYLEDHKLISLGSFVTCMDTHYYIEAFRWNGYKVVGIHGNVGIEVRANMLNGDVKIMCQDGIYTNEEACKNDNTIACHTF